MQHIRVIPRDFFNESKLLKCFGQLSLAIHDDRIPEGLKIDIEENGEPFDICLSEDGGLYIANYKTSINGIPVIFQSTYNSKAPFPFFCVVGYDHYQVFQEDGSGFEDEFLAAFRPADYYED